MLFKLVGGERRIKTADGDFLCVLLLGSCRDQTALVKAAVCCSSWEIYLLLYYFTCEIYLQKRNFPFTFPKTIFLLLLKVEGQSAAMYGKPVWFVIRNINETFSHKLTFFFSVWAHKVQWLDYSHTTRYSTLLLLPPFHVLFSFLKTRLPKSRPAWWIDCGLKYSHIPCSGFSSFKRTLQGKNVLTRKLMYSIYYFLLSSVEFIF